MKHGIQLQLWMWIHKGEWCWQLRSSLLVSSCYRDGIWSSQAAPCVATTVTRQAASGEELFPGSFRCHWEAVLTQICVTKKGPYISEECMARLRSPGSQKGKERRVLCFFGLKFCYKKMIEARTTDMGKGHGETMGTGTNLRPVRWFLRDAANQVNGLLADLSESQVSSCSPHWCCRTNKPGHALVATSKPTAANDPDETQCNACTIL